MWSPSSTPLRVRSRPNSRRILVAACSFLLAGTVPAAAQVVVFDPRNHLENALQTARQLESLAHEARSLAASPYSHLAGSSATARDMAALARSAQGLAATVVDLDRQMRTLYPDDLSGADLADLLAQGEARTQNARRTAADLARTAAELQRLGEGRDARLAGALAASDAAGGQTAAIQSSNQLLAVLAEDLAALRTLAAAQSRLLAEAAAREGADRAAGDADRRRAWGREAPPPPAPRFEPLARGRRGG